MHSLHVSQISRTTGFFSRSKTTSAETLHNMLHISVKMLHISVKLLHIKLTKYHSMISICISLSTTVRDIPYTLSTCWANLEHVGHFVTKYNIICQNVSHIVTHKCEIVTHKCENVTHNGEIVAQKFENVAHLPCYARQCFDRLQYTSTVTILPSKPCDIISVLSSISGNE